MISGGEVEFDHNEVLEGRRHAQHVERSRVTGVALSPKPPPHRPFACFVDGSCCNCWTDRFFNAIQEGSELSSAKPLIFRFRNKKDLLHDVLVVVDKFDQGTRATDELRNQVLSGPSLGQIKTTLTLLFNPTVYGSQFVVLGVNWSVYAETTSGFV